MISDYGNYGSYLRELLRRAAQDGVSQHLAAVEMALDGQAAKELRRLVALDVRREHGAFFTTNELRRKVVPRRGSATDDRVFYDPACGAGDLLVEAALSLPVFDSFDATVQSWGENLLGSDLQSDFVEAARLRLLLAAAYRSGSTIPERIPNSAFSGLVVGDGLAQSSFIRRADHIVLNPPFGYVSSPPGASWASGRVSAAAVFLAYVVEHAEIGASIAAILPDVLRSGTRYARWRSLMNANLAIGDIESHGVFDPATDIDVFVLHGEKRHSRDEDYRWFPAPEPGKLVGDFFNIHVGPVIPHRDPNKGPWHPFIWPKRLPLSGRFNPEGRSRRFGGRTFQPPFVAIRRTSRPGQALRADGVLVAGDREVAVENHLLVAQPKDGLESSCLDLMQVLEDQRTRDWLDSRIRTRHLTVSSIREIPWRVGGTNG